MFLFRLLLKNAFRHRLRTLLTMVGLVVAVVAFGMLHHRRRLVRRRRSQFQHAADHTQRDFADRAAAAGLC